MPYPIPPPAPPPIVQVEGVNVSPAAAIASEPGQSVKDSLEGQSSLPVSQELSTQPHALRGHNSVAAASAGWQPLASLTAPLTPPAITPAGVSHSSPVSQVSAPSLAQDDGDLDLDSPPELPPVDGGFDPDAIPEPPPEAAPGSDPANPEAAPQVYPEAATPEPYWSNGGITSTGDLLAPTQPTATASSPLDLTADYQAYDPIRQVVTARGNVVLDVGDGLLAADRLWANLFNRYVLLDGEVLFQRGEQVIQAERGEYNLLQGQGRLFDASGTVFVPSTTADFADPLSTAGAAREADPNQPIGDVRSPGGITLSTDAGANLGNTTAGGTIRRIRFEAAEVEFDAEGWLAQDVRLTNDPFSPPEFELRGDSARLTRLNELEDELYVENPRAVFDQSFAVPLLRSRLILRRGGSDEIAPVSLGYDGEDRGGLFLERTFRVVTLPAWTLSVTPQFLVQRFVDNSNISSPSNLGLEVDLDGQITPTTSLRANASFSGLDLDNFDDRLRASVRVRQALGTHTLNLEYSYRDRLFNGSLGFQDVQSNLGLVLLSPSIRLGDTGIVLTYQASAQYITADTDRPELLDPGEPDNLVSLGRFQGSIGLSRSFTLWRGEPLPATPDAGLRFTPNPVVPNLRFFVSGRGTYTYYTSDDTQESLSGVIGLAGTLGHFSRDFLDSTVFNISYRRSFIGEGQSPFRLDRDVDRNVLSGGIIQQIYGPFRLGFQSSLNLDTQEVINTTFVLEYSRRTYGIVLRFNPVQSSGFIGFRLNEFDWTGRAARFGGANIRPVEGGVIR